MKTFEVENDEMSLLRRKSNFPCVLISDKIESLLFGYRNYNELITKLIEKLIIFRNKSIFKVDNKMPM